MHVLGNAFQQNRSVGNGRSEGKAFEDRNQCHVKNVWEVEGECVGSGRRGLLEVWKEARRKMVVERRAW